MYQIVNEGLRPPEAEDLPPALQQLVFDCWNETPALRPPFSEIVSRLQRILDAEENDAEEQLPPPSPSFSPEAIRHNTLRHTGGSIQAQAGEGSNTL